MNETVMVIVVLAAQKLRPGYPEVRKCHCSVCQNLCLLALETEEMVRINYPGHDIIPVCTACSEIDPESLGESAGTVWEPPR